MKQVVSKPCFWLVRLDISSTDGERLELAAVWCPCKRSRKAGFEIKDRPFSFHLCETNKDTVNDTDSQSTNSTVVSLVDCSFMAF